MREYRFDIARVVCMTYLITYVHLYGYVYPQGRFTPYLPVSIAMAHACLGVFTFLSGFLLGKKYYFGRGKNSNVWTFYKKRLLRIIPLFVVASFLLWIINFNNAEATWNGLLCISPFVYPRPSTLYYIPIILWCYLVTPLISRRDLKWRIYVCLLLFVCLLVGSFLFQSIDKRFVFNVFFYFLGVTSAPFYDWKLGSSYDKVVKTIACLLFILLVVIVIQNSLFSTLWQMVVGAVGVFVILFICEDISKLLYDAQDAQYNGFKATVCKIVSIGSYASMACYMFHRFFYWVAETAWNPSDTSIKWLYMAAMVYPIMVVLSYAIQKLYDKLVKRQKLLWISVVSFVVISYSGYHFVDQEFMVAEELPVYDVKPCPEDDTLRVVIIGDSWAEYHKTFNCDTLFVDYARKMTQKPVRCQSKGKGGALSKEIYHLMFRKYIEENSGLYNFCTQSLIEDHPHYCVVMAGINDTWKKRPISYYVGNYRLIIRLLLANHIRPVVMEIPDFEMGEWLNQNRRCKRILYRFYSYFTGVKEDDITPFRNGLKKMLDETSLADSVLYIPVSKWLPQNHNYSEEIYQIDHVHLTYQGYHLLDSCMVSEIIKDYDSRNHNK